MGWLYLVLTSGQIVQFFHAPAMCHLLADHYQDGGYYRTLDEHTRKERWLHVDRAVCIETVDVSSNIDADASDGLK